MTIIIIQSLSKSITDMQLVCLDKDIFQHRILLSISIKTHHTRTNTLLALLNI